jgi:hypothetical protein
MRRQPAEKEQRDVQTLTFDELAAEFVGALEHSRQLVDPRCRISVGNGCKK